MDSITLRAVTEHDELFLQQLYASTREAELAQVPWNAEQKAAFCQMQFVAQSTDYRQNYPAATHEIIERGGISAGRLYVDRRSSIIDVIDIALLPEHRGLGIGTQLLSALQAEAGTAGKGLTIHVEKFNPALRLYQRLAFQQIEDKGIYLLMEWRAPAVS